MATKFLKVGLYNAGSLGTNHDNIIASVGSSGVDILAVNETWLHQGEEGRAPNIPGYRLRHTPRPRAHKSRGGGVGFYLRRGVSARTWSHPVEPAHAVVEQMWLTINVNGKRVMIGTAYRPNWVRPETFFDAITDSISSIERSDNLILVGDFNINFLDVDDYKTKKLRDFLAYFELSQIITQPTHFTNTGGTLIDLVCTDLRARSTTLRHVGSDTGHCLVLAEFNIKRHKSLPSIISYRAIKNINIEFFNNDLIATNWNFISQCSDMNEMVDLFNYGVLSVFDIHAPVKSVVVRKHSYPWITDTVKLMMGLRDGAAAAYNKTGLQCKKTLYKHYKSLVSKALFEEKKSYFKCNINSRIRDPKSLWKNLQKHLLPKTDNELPESFNDPNIINQHFLNLPNSNFTLISNLTFYEYHKFSAAVFSIHYIGLESLIAIIKSLNSNAEGCDAISLSMLLLTFPNSIDCVLNIVNSSIETCTYPEIWKLALVRPLPKVQNPVDLKDLRPISILPCLSKIMEKAVCTQLTDYLEKNNILPAAQSGFRRGRSTTSALLDVTDNILCAQDKGMCTVLVLLDFSRAFDCLNTNLLLSKLSYYGFDSAALRWFDSYLSNRYQRVKVTRSDGSTVLSDKLAVTRGVPQGSILGPILFILYSADISNAIKHSSYHCYCDDTQIYISCRPNDINEAIGKLNNDLASIAEWSANNCLLLNPLKTKYIIFGSKHQLASLAPTQDVMLLGEPVERVYEARNLGLIMDSELRFEKHVTNCMRECFYRLKVLYRMRPFLSTALRIQLTESLVLSKLNYMDMVIHPRLLAKTRKVLQRVQNACARYCFDIPPRAHVTPFLNKNALLKMIHRRKLHLACLLFGVVKHGEPSYLHAKLSWKPGRHSHGARACSAPLLTQRHATAAFRGSFRYAASKCWNNIPPPIRNLRTLYTFRLKLKNFIFEHQKREALFRNDTSAI